MSRNMALSSQACSLGLGRDLDFLNPLLLLKWFLLSGILSLPGNIPPVLQSSTYIAPYPCDGSLSTLSEGAAHGDFIVTDCAVIVSVVHIPHQA